MVRIGCRQHKRGGGRGGDGGGMFASFCCFVCEVKYVCKCGKGTANVIDDDHYRRPFVVENANTVPPKVVTQTISKTKKEKRSPPGVVQQQQSKTKKDKRSTPGVVQQQQQYWYPKESLETNITAEAADVRVHLRWTRDSVQSRMMYPSSLRH